MAAASSFKLPTLPGGLDYGTLFQSIGAGMSAGGAYRGAQAQKAALRYNSAVSKNNAQIATWRAQSILQTGQRNEQAQRLRTAQLKGSQTARLAANGVDINEGSALRILQDTDFMGDQDAATIRDNSRMEAWGVREQGRSFLNESSMYDASADSISPSSAAFSSLIGDAGTVASSWYKYNKTKAA